MGDIILTEGLNQLNVQLVPVALPIPKNVIELPYYFTVLNVEGIEFTRVALEGDFDWEAFGKCLQQAYGPSPWAEGWIADGVGLAMCMATKNLPFPHSIYDPEMQQWVMALYGCGFAHPEYLTDNAKSIISADSYWVGKTEWDRFCNFGYALAPSMFYLCYGGPPSEVLTAYLSSPIVMDALRGVTINCLYRHQAQPGYTVTGTAIFRPLPTFATALGPPAFRGNWSFTDAQDGKQVNINIGTVFGAGYYYPGIYDGEIDLGGGGVDSIFIVRNLAKVTGEGTV